MLRYQNFGASFRAPKSRYRSQKHPVLLTPCACHYFWLATNSI